MIIVLLLQVTYDQWGDPTPWAANWEMAKSVEDHYGCITPPVDMYQLRQAELWIKMEHHFNPDCVQMTDVLQRALLDAEHSRLKQFTEATETYECDVRDGRRRSTSSPPSEWSDDHHILVVEYFVKATECDQDWASSQRKREYNARQLICGGISEADIESAIAIEQELFAHARC
jgi:hypothetical protein